MPKAKYQLDDFLMLVTDDYKEFVMNVGEILLEDGYKRKIQLTRSKGLQMSYSQPKVKSVIGIVLYFFLQDERLMVRVNADNHGKYPDALHRLPKRMTSQIAKADDCVKFSNPQKCWQGCIGYDFHIKEEHYQKCITNCFQFEVDFESIPYLLELAKSESEARNKSVDDTVV